MNKCLAYQYSTLECCPPEEKVGRFPHIPLPSVPSEQLNSQTREL